MLFNSDSEIKVMELVNKIDLLLQDKENRQLPPNDIAAAYDIANTITKLYPSNYLGFLKMAQICMCRQEPLLIDRGSDQNHTYTKTYLDISKNLKQARILASANQMAEIDTIDMQFKQKIACEEKRINKRHAFIMERMPILIRNYPQILNRLKLIPPNLPHPIAGNHLSFIDNKKNIVFDGDFVKYSPFLGCLCFCKGKLYYCSNSIYSKYSFWSGTGYFCKIEEVHIDEKGYLLDNNNKQLIIDGKTLCIKFKNYSYQFISGWEKSSVCLAWKCFWGVGEKTEVTSIEYSFFTEILGKD